MKACIKIPAESGRRRKRREIERTHTQRGSLSPILKEGGGMREKGRKGRREGLGDMSPRESRGLKLSSFSLPNCNSPGERRRRKSACEGKEGRKKIRERAGLGFLQFSFSFIPAPPPPPRLALLLLLALYGLKLSLVMREMELPPPPGRTGEKLKKGV